MQFNILPNFSGDRLRSVRKIRKMPIKQLAMLTGLSETQIYRLERDQRPNVYAVTLGRIAMVLQTNIEYLIGITENSGHFIDLSVKLSDVKNIRGQEE